MLGASGGLIADLRIFANDYLFGDAPDMTTGLILDNISNSLFAICILMTRGVVEKSRLLVLTGALAGVVIGIITLPIGLLLNPPWPIFPIVRTGLIGLSAGLIWGMSNPLSSRRLHAALAGFVGGILGIPIFYLVIQLSVILQTGIQLLGGSIRSDVYFYVVHLAGLVVIGAAQSFAIWLLILRFDMRPDVNDALVNGAA